MVEIIDNRIARNSSSPDSESGVFSTMDVFGVSVAEASIITDGLFDIYREAPNVAAFLKAALRYSQEQDSPEWSGFSLFLMGRMSEMNEICWESRSMESLFQFVATIRALMGGD